MNSRNVYGVVALVAVLVAVLFPASRSLADVPDLTASWNRFIGAETSVCDILENLGPVVYNGGSPNNASLLVIWHNGYSAVAVNGRPVAIESVILEGNEIVILGAIKNTQTFQAVFSVTERGNLLIEMSDAQGYGGERLVIGPRSGTVELASVCRCWGLAKKKRACTNTECDNSGTSCNTGTSGSAFCEWRASDAPIG